MLSGRARTTVLTALACAFLLFSPLAAAGIWSDVAAAATRAANAIHAATTTVFVSPTGSDRDGCTRAAPCATFNRAYRAAQPGDVVQVAGGTYPEQELDADSRKTSSDHVVFRPAAGATVIVNGVLRLGDGNGTPAASHVTLESIQATVIQAFHPARDVTWTNITARNFYVRGVQELRVKGGSFGPCTSSVDPCANNKIDLASPPEQPNNNITIDGTLFHDFRIGNPGDHFECMFLFGGTKITVRNSTFRNCEFYDVFLQHAGGALNGVTLENNHFGIPWNGAGVQNRATAIGFSPRGTPFSDVLMQRNSFDPGTGVAWNDDGDGSVYTAFRAVGNIFGIRSNCSEVVTYTDNLWPSGKCGATDRDSAPFGYVFRNGVLQPDPAVATRIQKAFAGAAVKTAKLARIAKSVGWSTTTLRRVLKDKVYLGGIYGAPGAHPALVPRAKWLAAERRVR
jgi:hypothetical protein